MTAIPVVAAASGLAAAPLLAAEPNVATPLVLVGGGPDDPAITAEALSLSGGSRARVAVIAAGSSNPPAAGTAYQRYFTAFGVESRYVALPDLDAASSPEAVRQLAGSDLLFFTGGDQRRLADRLARTPALGAIQDGWIRGAVVAGTSAGAMPWGGVYIANGSSQGAFSVAFDRDVQGNPGLELRPGLRLLDDVLVDTHFDTRARLGRLLLALASTPSASALGIDELTGAILTGDDLRVTGQGTLTVIEARRLVGNNAGRASARLPFAAGPFSLSRLKGGQTFRLRQSQPERAVRPAPTPTPAPQGSFFFGLFGPASPPPPGPMAVAAPRQPVTLIAAAAPPSNLSSLQSFIRDSGGTQARILILTGNGASRDARTWRGHLLLLGAGSARVLTASEIHDQNLSQALESATGVFFLEDAAGSLLDACNADRRRLRDILATYANRLPLGAAGLGVRILGEVAYFGNPADPARRVKEGLELVPGTTTEEQLWEPGGLERLVQTALMAGPGLGIGLGPENSVRIEHGQIAVIGRGQAVFLEGRTVSQYTLPASASVEPASAIGFEASVIPPDGVYDYAGRRPRF